MALGIQGGSLGARAFGGVQLPAPARSAEREAATAAAAPDDSAASSSRAFRAASTSRVERVQRLDDAASPALRNPGIAAYLGVERNALTDPTGGELVGIDFYV